MQIHDGYGYLKDFPVERIYPDIQRMVIARALAD